MKKEYIDQIKKELSVPRKIKKEIVRDLEEVFASSLEHGEDEAQIIERLGSPKDFAENMEEQIGFDRARYKTRKKLMQVICAFVAAIVFFFIYIVTKALQLPKNVIGQADSMTEIKVETAFAFNFMTFSAILGIAALIVAIILTIKYIHTKH